MWKTILGILDEKHFVLALLATAAAVAAHYGLQLDTSAIAVMLAPVMIAVGAHGWGAAAQQTASAAGPDLLTGLSQLVAQPPIASSAPAPRNTPSSSSQPPSSPPPAGHAGFVRFGLLAVLGAIALLNIVSTSCSPSQRTTALGATVVSLDAAEQSLEAYDRTHELAIAQSATSLSDGQTQLAAWRSKVNEVQLAISSAYRAVAVAWSANTSSAFTTATAAAQAVAAELADIEGLEQTKGSAQ